MDQDARRDAIIDKINAAVPLTPVDMDPTISDIEAPVFRLRAWNWTADKLRKVSCQRHTIYQPPLDVLNTIIYPKPEFEAPIFLSFFLMTGADKFVSHLNIYTPRTDSDYLATWVDPCTEILGTFNDFESKGAYPDWMLPYKHACAVHGMHDMARLDELTDCALRFLDVYVDALTAAGRISDDAYKAFDQAQAVYRKTIPNFEKIQAEAIVTLSAE